MAEQEILIQIPEQPERRAAEPEGTPAAKKYLPIDRAQMVLRTIEVEELIGQDHKARAIWDLTGRLDLSRFEESTRTTEGQAGRPAWSPRLLVSLWLYGYSEGITSARELERTMEYEPGLEWLAGLQSINHHTLSDFRVRRKAALDQLFTQLLVVLEQAQLLSLERVMHDGAKVRARAGTDSFRREKTIREKLAQAEELVGEDPQAVGRKRRQKAHERAQRERKQRVEQALAELEKLRQHHTEQPDQRETRVSVTEPEARRMKHGDQAIAPSYNVQVSTDARCGVIVGVDLNQNSGDAAALDPAIEEVRKNLGRQPVQVVADGGYTNRRTIEKMQERNVDFIGSLPDPKERSEAAMKAVGIDPHYAPHFFVFQPETNALRCPAGCQLPYWRRNRKRGNDYQQYRARGQDCQKCAFQPQCCPRAPWKGRTVSRLEQETEVVAGFRRKMATQEAQAIYRQRGAVAEFPFAWIKEKFGVRKFRVFGMAKARTEAVWACLTHNVMLWKRLVWSISQLTATVVVA